MTIQPAEAAAPGQPELSRVRLENVARLSQLGAGSSGRTKDYVAALDTCTAFLRAESKLHTALLMGDWRGLEGGGSQIMGLFTNWGGACILRSTLHTQAVSTVPPLQLLVPPEHVNIIGQSGCVYLSTSNNSLGVLRDV